MRRATRAGFTLIELLVVIAILAAGGNDGHFVDVGSARELEGVLPVSALLAAGVSAIRTRDGEPVTRGLVDTGDGRVRPALIGRRPVLLVEATGADAWRVIEFGKGKRKREERSSCKAAH